MKPGPFDYVRPTDVAEACAALAQDSVTTAAIAGGQSLVPMLNLRVAMVDLLVDISRLDALKATRETPEAIEIGALTTHAAIEDGKIPDAFNGLMRRVAAGISYRAVRHHGTIGGSVALADPAADWPACLVALGAEVRIAGRDGMRREPVTAFVRDAYATSLAAGEIVLGFILPRPDAALRWGFVKMSRKSGAFADSIACVVAYGEGGPVTVVLGAAAPRPCRLPTVAAHLRAGRAAEEGLRQAIAQDLATQVRDADAYQARLHTASVLRAVREMQA